MILVNGQPSDRVPAGDRGLLYGDGVFRTLLLRRGMPLALWRHLAKLADDCRRLGISCPADAMLKEAVEIVAAEEPDCVLRITVTRGTGGRGYRSPKDLPPTWILATSPVPSYPASYRTDGVKATVCRIRLGRQPALAGVKHLNRLENVLARQEWEDPEIVEGLMLDESGWIVEGTMTNLFVLRQGTLYTPDLSACGVAGVQRDRIMAAAVRYGLTVQVTKLDMAFLGQGDEVWLSNSVIGLWPVRQVDEKSIKSGPMAALIGKMLDEQDI